MRLFRGVSAVVCAAAAGGLGESGGGGRARGTGTAARLWEGAGAEAGDHLEGGGVGDLGDDVAVRDVIRGQHPPEALGGGDGGLEGRERRAGASQQNGGREPTDGGGDGRRRKGACCGEVIAGLEEVSVEGTRRKAEGGPGEGRLRRRRGGGEPHPEGPGRDLRRLQPLAARPLQQGAGPGVRERRGVVLRSLSEERRAGSRHQMWRKAAATRRSAREPPLRRCVQCAHLHDAAERGGRAESPVSCTASGFRIGCAARAEPRRNRRG